MQLINGALLEAVEFKAVKILKGDDPFPEHEDEAGLFEIKIPAPWAQKKELMAPMAFTKLEIDFENKAGGRG